MNKKIFFAIVILLIFVLLIINIFEKHNTSFKLQKRGEKFPSLEGITWLSEKPDIKGKICLIEFWATWCPPCVSSIKHLNELHEKFSPKGLLVIGISNEKVEDIKNFEKRLLFSGDIKSAKELNEQKIPESFFKKFAGNNSELSNKLEIKNIEKDKKWMIKDSSYAKEYYVEKEKEKLNVFQKGIEIHYYKGTDLKSKIQKELKLTGIPIAFIIKDGKIIGKGHPLTIKDKDIEKFLEKKEEKKEVKAEKKDFSSVEKLEWVSKKPEEAVKEKTFLIEFWATWCPPCKESIKHLNELHNKFKEKKFVIIGVTDEKAEAVKKFQEKTEMLYPIAIDKDRLLFSELKIDGIPHALLVKKGMVFWQGHPNTINKELIEKFLSE